MSLSRLRIACLSLGSSFAAAVSMGACGGGGGGGCLGYEGCHCYEDGGCEPGLECSPLGLCGAPGSGSGGQLGSAGDTGTSGPCTPGTYRCVGADLEECGATQSFSYVDTCVSSGLCNAAEGACDAPVCEPGEQVCAGNDVHECNPARTAHVLKESCSGTNFQCDPLANECLGPKLNFPCTGALNERRWIHRTSNSFNAQGWLHAGSDGTSEVELDDVCDGSFRFSGWTALDEAGIWGAQVGLHLCEEAADDANPGTVHPIGSCPVPGDQDKIRGVSFSFCSVSGDYPSAVRVTFPQSVGEGAYKIISNPAAGQSYTVWMTDADVRVWWEADPSAATPAQVQAIAWSVPPLELANQWFDVCINNVTLLGTL